MLKPTACLAVVSCLLVSWGASAEEQPLSEEERPWARGISLESQQAAFELFNEGNTLLGEGGLVQAIEKYREAIEHWDHPAIHYNLAFALLKLDQPIEAHQHLVAALRHGEEPLDTDKFQTARSYKDFIEKQLAWVELHCDSAGASVSMDGRPLFLAPGRHEGFVRPGPHSFVISKEDHSPTSVVHTLSPGEQRTLNLRLYSPEELIRYRRRWPSWKPWAVVGAGMAVALGGGVFYMRARDTYRDFDTQVAACGGCMASSRLTDIRARGDTLQRAAFSMYAVGGGALVTGAVLAYINRPQPYRVRPDEIERGLQLSITPLLMRNETGVLTTLRF